jgi:hypothetical protein
LNDEFVKAKMVHRSCISLSAADMLALSIIKRINGDEVLDTINGVQLEPSVIWAQVNSKIRANLEG